MPDMNEMRRKEIEAEMLDNGELLKDEKKKELEKRVNELEEQLKKIKDEDGKPSISEEDSVDLDAVADNLFNSLLLYGEVYGKGKEKSVEIEMDEESVKIVKQSSDDSIAQNNRLKKWDSYTCRGCGALHEDIDEYYAFCHYCGERRRGTYVTSLHGK